MHRDNAPLGAPCWIDLMTSDPERSRAFYGELFGWTSEVGGEEYGGYITFRKGDDPVAGAMRATQPGMPDVWTIYLAVENAKSTVDTAEAAGSQVIVPAMDITDLGAMAVVTDAGGAVIGLWQPGTHRGFTVLNEPGAPSWFELHTRDFAASVAFYEQVFGWDTHVVDDSDQFRYTTLGEGDGQLAGIMDANGFLPEGVPAHWSIYFGVEDTDKALARIIELGGAVAVPAEDTPYGRLASATDPTGALFKLVAG